MKNNYHKHIITLTVLFLLIGIYQDLNAQMIQGRIERKSSEVVRTAVGTVKSKARLKVDASKRGLKSSLRGGVKYKDYNESPTVEELIADEAAKKSIKDRRNRSRYVELFGQWQDMPSDADMALKAKAQRIIDSLNNLDRSKFRVTKNIWDDSRPMIVFGWHPHWLGDIYKGYDYQLFNVVSYYSYDINPDNGSPQNPEVMAKFLGSDFVETATKNGCSALLSITCHGEQNVMRFLSKNRAAQQTLLDSVMFILDSVNADGIEINFEGVNTAVKDDFIKFVRILSNTVTASRGDTSFVLMSVPTYDPDNVYDIALMQDFVDMFIIKGGNFYNTPDGLKRIPNASFNYSNISTEPDLRTTVDYYMSKLGQIYSDRLILALPYYGTRWMTDGITDEILEMNHIPYNDIQFDFVMQMEDTMKFPEAESRFDSSHTAHVFSYKDYYGIDTAMGDIPNNVTIYYDDSISLLKKYQFIFEARLGGVGIQSLGYDMGFDHLSTLLESEFMDIVMPEDEYAQKLSEQSSRTRSNAIYFLVVLLYLSIFLSIGFCAALFKKSIRNALFEKKQFRFMYMSMLAFLMLSICAYLGVFESATLPLLLGVLFGSIISWLSWKYLFNKKSTMP